MNISEVSGSLENIPLPQEQKTAMLQLIDAKINNDMKEVIAKLDHLEEKMESKFQLINEKFQLTNEKIQLTHDKIQTINWVVGIAMAIMLFFAAKK